VDIEWRTYSDRPRVADVVEEKCVSEICLWVVCHSAFD